MKVKGMGKIIYLLCILLLLQTVSFPVFADPLLPDAEMDGLGLSDNSNLSSLIVENGTLIPAFSPDQTDYAIVGNRSTALVKAIGTADDATATVSIAGYGYIPDQFGSNQAEIPDFQAETTFTIVVTAEDKSRKTYRIKAYTDYHQKIIPTANTLDVLLVSTGQLTPAFFPFHSYCALTVGNEVEVIDIRANSMGFYSEVLLNSTTLPFSINLNRQPLNRGYVPLFVGFNRIDIDVVSTDGKMPNLYSIIVFREAAPPVELSSNKDLSGLTISQGSLSPEFNAATKAYTARVASVTEGISVTATPADSKANVSVDGGLASKMVRLNEESATIIPILVTAEDGSDQTYTVTVSKEAPTPLSGNNDLSGLVISQGSLTPDFEAEESAYAVTVDRELTSITIRATLADDKASLTVNGEPVSSGLASDPIELVDELTTISIVVQAENSITKTYTIGVTKEAQKTIGRFHHLIAERTFLGRTIARYDDLRFGLQVKRDESGLIDYLAPIRSKANDVRLQIPYADLMTKITKGSRDLILKYQGQEIRIPMTVFEGDWLAGMPAASNSTFEIHLLADEAGQTTCIIDFFVVEQINESTRLVHRKPVQK
jgi:hypothetical protein